MCPAGFCFFIFFRACFPPPQHSSALSLKGQAPSSAESHVSIPPSLTLLSRRICPSDRLKPPAGGAFGGASSQHAFPCSPPSRIIQQKSGKAAPQNPNPRPAAHSRSSIYRAATVIYMTPDAPYTCSLSSPSTSTHASIGVQQVAKRLPQVPAAARKGTSYLPSFPLTGLCDPAMAHKSPEPQLCSRYLWVFLVLIYSATRSDHVALANGMASHAASSRTAHHQRKMDLHDRHSPCSQGHRGTSYLPR